MRNRTLDMTVGNPTKHIMNFAIPLIMTNMGQQLYMIVDGAIVGRGVGVQALAAVGATDWCYWLILWTVGGLAQGFATFVSRAFGEKNLPLVNRTIATAVQLCVLIGAVLTILGVAAAKPVLMMLNTPTDILPGAAVYLRTMIAGTLIVMGYNLAAAILQGLGNGKTPLIAMIISAVLNIGLDCLFVFVFKWGIIGAAMASLTAQLVSFLFCLVQILKLDCIRLDRDAWRFDGRRFRSMLCFGIPVAFQYVVITFGGMVLQSSINLQGSVFIAGYTATNKLYGFLQCFAMSIGQSTCTFVSQNFGAGRKERVRRGVAEASKIVLLMAAAIMAVSILTRWQILSIFLDTSVPEGMEALEISARYLTIMLFCFPVLHILHVFRNVLQAMGISVWSLASGFAELGARVFMAKAAIYWIGVDALFLSEPASWLGAMLCVFLPYFHYRKTLLDLDP